MQLHLICRLVPAPEVDVYVGPVSRCNAASGAYSASLSADETTERFRQALLKGDVPAAIRHAQSFRVYSDLVGSAAEGLKDRLP